MGKISASRYKIDIQGLEEKSYEYDFDGDSTFFSHFENSPVEKGNWSGKITLVRSSTMIRARFEIDATISLQCDRTLRDFDFPLKADQWISFKFGEEWEELDVDVWVIPANLDQLDIAPYVYEFIVLGIPMKKLHPDLQDGDQSEGLVYRSEEDGDGEDTDPRWDSLRFLKNKQ